MRCCCCFLLLLFSTAPAHGGDLTLFGGFNHPGNITLGQISESVSGNAGQLLTDTKDFGVFGARLYRSNAPVGFEHTLAFSPNFIDSRASALIYNTNLRVQVPALRVRPYVTVGVGLVRAGGDGPASFGTKFSLNYGAGLNVSLIGPLGARVDVRGYSIRGVEEQSLNVLETSIGVVFSF